jgi:hypothetical protein
MNAVNIQDLAAAVDLAIKGVINGAVRQQKRGTVIDFAGTKFDFQFNVVVPNGLNAIQRVTTSQPTVAERVTRTLEPEAVSTTTRTVEHTSTTTQEGAQTSEEKQEQQQESDGEQVTSNGRTTTTVFTYEQ